MVLECKCISVSKPQHPEDMIMDDDFVRKGEKIEVHSEAVGET